ncbi:hypothetical protein ABNN70_15190 [Sporolactobacillus sp. Y61]|uniref:DUF3221 domain-containing protein n=1 Tax=Sporolactobacillus sp. Y61 TaxID=3160863 RepID=A0AAU8IFF1_9BACL
MKRITIMLILLMLVAGCAPSPSGSVPESPPSGEPSETVRVILRIMDHTDKYRYYGISVNKVHPDPGQTMVFRIKYIKKKTEILHLDKGDPYRIDLAPAVTNPIDAMKDGTWLKKKIEQADQMDEKHVPIRTYITPVKDNQTVTIEIS